MRRRYTVLVSILTLACLTTLSAGPAAADRPEVKPMPRSRTRVHLPIIAHGDPCAPIPGVSYQPLSVLPPPSDRPAEAHADLNLALRGYAPTTGSLGLVDYGGGSDPDAPQLAWLFQDGRAPIFHSLFRVYDWDWARNARGALIGWPDVTLARLAATAGEIIHVPQSGYHIGDGFAVLVLYASEERLTLKFTREDNVVRGYTLHLEDLCVEPRLLALYRSLSAAGRGSLPALRSRQALGRARSSAIGVAIRDSGRFLDPRSRKDWWQGR